MGRLLTLQDITEKISKKNSFVTHAIILTFVMLTLSFLVLYYSFGGLFKRLEKYSRETKEAKEELEKAHNELEQTVVERTAELAETNIALLEEVAERKQAESSLKEQWVFLQSVIESLSHPFYVIDANSYEILLANKASTTLIDGDLTQGMTCYRMTHGQDEPCDGAAHPCPLIEVKKAKAPVSVEHLHYDANGNERFYEIHAYPIFDSKGRVSKIIEYNIDITARRNAEGEKKKLWAQLVNSQKMEAVGILAGGVAHDFNNILTTILGYSEIISMKLHEYDPIRNMIGEIYSAGEKAAGLTRQLLAFSRKQVMELQVANLNNIIESIAKMLDRMIGDDIIIELYPSESIGNILVDIGQIEQILMNLAVNARDAMPDGGHVIIETSEMYLDETYAKVHSEVQPGYYALLTFTDTGLGMNQEVLERIFDPFFTTKEKGKGTGLGLATVYGIIKQHNGHIYAYSEEGKGTTFKIYFPLVSEDIKEETLKDQRAKTMPHGTETILIVDDDSAVRKLIWDTLDPLGYILMEAGNGAEAIQLTEGTDSKIDLIISDVIMPGMNGRELVKALTQKYPDMKAILMSGYTDNVIAHHGVLEPGVIFLSKPVMPVVLTNKIRDVLDDKTKTMLNG